MGWNELVIFIQVQPDGSNKKETKNVKAAIARLASQENLTSSYDLVLGLVRRPPSPRPCRFSSRPRPAGKKRYPAHPWYTLWFHEFSEQ